MVIDFLKGQISLPQNQGRKTPVTLPVAQVGAVEVEEIEKRSNKGRTFKVWNVWLNGKSDGAVTATDAGWHTCCHDTRIKPVVIYTGASFAFE